MSAYGLSVPQIAPAVVFDSLTDQFTGIVPSIQNASAFLYDPVNGLLYTADYENNTLGVINPASDSWAHQAIGVGANPVALALNTTSNEIYVANSGSGDVTIVNGTSNSVKKSNIIIGTSPDGLAFDAHNQVLFVADGKQPYISPLNVSTDTSQTAISLPGIPGGIAYSSSSGMLVVTIPTDNSVELVHAKSGNLDRFQTVGTGAGPVQTSVNSTEFVIGNASGPNLVVLNSSTGSIVGSDIIVGSDVTALATETTGPKLLAWSSQTR
ncbi:MAG: YncE family protein, partial [Thermoplasmata archaeon]